MELLKVNEIIEFLNKEFLGLDPAISSGLLLTPKIMPEERIIELKEQLKMNDLAEDFVQFIKQYDLGNFELSNIQFGYEGDYVDLLLELNNEGQYWYQDVWKSEVMVIALSDPFTILLSLKDQAIYVISPEIAFDQKVKVADSFTQFFSGLGTAFKAEREEKQDEFLELAARTFNLDALDFWENTI